MKYGFIGCGNMGGAIAKALAKATTDFAITDRSGKAIALAAEIPCGYLSTEEIAGQCERIFLGVKPHMMKGVLAPLQPILAEKKPLLITMAAGLTMAQIEEFAGCEIPVIRIMPNTPVAIGKGVTQYCANRLVSQEMIQDLLTDMRFSGIWDQLDESLIDAGSAISGSGPAYVYMFIEALADGAVACGIPRAKALEYAAATVIGAGELVLASGQHPGALKDAVCSPMGSTISGIRALENHGFRAAAMEAVIATYNRNKELGK
jgi:pyrroline-5-carboxylate reductase